MVSREDRIESFLFEYPPPEKCMFLTDSASARSSKDQHMDAESTWREVVAEYVDWVETQRIQSTRSGSTKTIGQIQATKPFLKWAAGTYKERSKEDAAKQSMYLVMEAHAKELSNPQPMWTDPNLAGYGA